VTDVPEGYLPVGSGVGRANPRELLIVPAVIDGDVQGVVEVGLLRRVDDADRELLDRITVALAVAIRSARERERREELLEETQRQAEELQAQQEELRVSNEELEEQGRALRESQTRLENQHAELEQTNVQLEEQTQRLERQKREMLRAQEALAENAKTLERSSRYKSEFLANMSHELRTPLNSSLILAKLLADNPHGNLDEEQVRFARTIHSSNNDLLTLINDIPRPVQDRGGAGGHRSRIREPRRGDRRAQGDVRSHRRRPQARLPHRPRRECAAGHRHRQPAPDADPQEPAVERVQVHRQGGGHAAGIRPAGRARRVLGARHRHRHSEQQQQVIFEAFRQADGTTSRQFGGTGLGLSISRELARLLGGAIRLQSAPGLGSTFTLDLPAKIEARRASAGEAPVEVVQAQPAPRVPAVKPTDASTSRVAGPHIEDDRTHRRNRDRLILVVEDDQRFARVLYDLAHELAFDCVHCSTAGEAIELSKRLKPSGIILDVNLPDESGLSVLERIKRDPAVRHIPVHMVSGDDHSQAALGLGAVGYALKPVAREDLVKALGRLEERFNKRISRVLVVEDDAQMRESIARLLQGDAVEITTVGTVAEALKLVESEEFDCLVTDLQLPDASGYDMLEKLSEGGRHSFLPVIVYTGRALTRDEETRLRRYSKSIIIKGARSPERLLDEVTLFLHRVESTLPAEKQNILRRVRQRDEVFEGRKILVAEDDVRNIFALTRVLEPLGAQVEIARNGQEAVDRVLVGDIDLVLMDIMMPVKDGLAAMREIRAKRELEKLPILAITAKAMADDRKQCLDAGANDYIAKPIDIEQLISLCRVWMPK
jgi:CheY-like chemotaxis protein